MVSSYSPDYMIFHPEKAGLLDILILCLFKRRLSDCKFIETSQATLLQLEDCKPNWLLIAIGLVLQWIFSLINKPLAFVGSIAEFTLNLFSLNGGFFGLIYHLLTGTLVIPNKDSADYRSAIGHIDGRLDLYQTSSLLSYMPHMGPMKNTAAVNDANPLDLCMMAAKVAYENEAYIRNAVTNHWKMQFVGFYSCWNGKISHPQTPKYTPLALTNKE